MNVAALRRMADQDVSPNERDIARAKLEAMGAWLPPPRPPAPSAAAAPGPDYSGWFRMTFAGNAGAPATTNVRIFFHTNGTVPW